MIPSWDYFEELLTDECFVSLVSILREIAITKGALSARAWIVEAKRLFGWHKNWPQFEALTAIAMDDAAAYIESRKPPEKSAVKKWKR